MTTRINDMMTESELIAALQAAVEELPEGDEPGTITTGEAADALDCSDKTALKRLKALHEEGVVQASMVWRTDLWDTRKRVKGWRYVGEQK